MIKLNLSNYDFTNVKYFIGESYRYPNSKNVFILKNIRNDKTMFYFECGHWCTDTVFMDLIRVKTGIQVHSDKQLELELNLNNR